MRYNDVRPSIKSGDVLVWHYTDWYMRLVSLFTTSKYNHIGVAIVISGRVMVLEAVGRGVQLNPLSEHLPCYLITMPDYWNADLETFAFSTVGHKYSVWQAILGGLGLLDAGKDNRWQCAELTNTVLSSSRMAEGAEDTPTSIVETLMENGLTISYVKEE